MNNIENTKTKIMSALEELSTKQKDMFNLTLVLNEHGVGMRDLQAALGCTPRELSDLNQKLADLKLMAVSGDRLVAPIEVRQVMMNETPPMNMLNATIERLSSSLMPAVYKSSKEQKPFYEMAEEVIKWVLRNESIQDLNWLSFSELVCNFAVLFLVFGHFESSIKQKSDLLLVKALRLCRQHVMHDSDQKARLLLFEASQFIEGFLYTQARALIEEAENIMHTKGLNKDDQVLLFLVTGLYHLTYGQNLAALAYFNMAYEKTSWGDFYSYLIVCLIAKELAEIEQFDSAIMWLKRLDERFIPDNEIKFLLHLTHALLEKDDNKAEMEFLKAKDIIENPDAPIWGQYFVARSSFFSNRYMERRSEEEYKKYLFYSEKYCSTDAGYYLLRGKQVIRMVNSLNELTAKEMTMNLDMVNLKGSDISVGVRLQIMVAFCEYHLNMGAMQLAKTYAELGLQLLEESNKNIDEKILCAASKVFCQGHIPSYFSDIEYYFQELLIKAELKECQQTLVRIGEEGRYKKIFKDVRRRIKELKKEMPAYKDELVLLSAHILSLSKPYEASEIMRKIVGKARGLHRVKLAKIASNYLGQIGFNWEAKDILQCMEDSVFTELNRGIQATYMLELATITEDVGMRNEAGTHWEKLVELTQGSELLSNVYFARAVTAYLHESYMEASLHICSCLSCYTPEEWVHDETLASYYSYQSVILSQSYRFADSKAAILRAMEEWPDLKSPSAFNLFYNLAYYCMGLEDYAGAREALENAKNLKLDEQQKADMKGLYEILALPKNERRLFFENPNETIETEDIISY